MDLADTLLRLKPIVLHAGSILMKYYQNTGDVTYKSDINLVTIADQESEAYLAEALGKEFPEIGLLAEEGHASESGSGYRFIVDPLDGTTSYAHGFPLFAVSVGLTDPDDEPVAGVVYNPYYSEYFAAAKGLGATRNDLRIRVSDTPDIRKALLGTGFPYNRREIMGPMLARLERVLQTVHDIRRTGSAALDICFTAAGRTDGYFESGLKAWDIAAALVILREAGGSASDLEGQPVSLFGESTAVSNGRIHQGLIDLIRENR